MFRRECTLCGGKLNGTVCTECGLDNSKSDSQYKTLEGHRDYEVAVTPNLESYDPYEYVMYELPKTGVSQKVILEAGSYKGGVHIPEGTYRLEVVSGVGRIELEDHYHGIYVSYSLSEEETEEDIAYMDDLRIYAGTRIEVEEDVIIAIATEDAVFPLTNMPNPNVTTGIFKERFVVGTDIPEGVYDVTCLEGSGIFEYSVELSDGYSSSYEGKLIGAGDSGFSEVYKNVVLPDGTEVLIRDMTVELIPSEVIESEDYISYYE